MADASSNGPTGPNKSVGPITGVDTKHRDYIKFAGSWEKCRLVYDGEEAVKAAAEKFLPRLEDQSQQQYEAYRDRGMFFEATTRTVQGLTGSLHHKPPILEGTNDDDTFFDDLVPSFMTFKNFVRDVTQEVLVTGRVGLMIDAPLETGAPYLASYAAEDIINWRTTWVKGQEILTFLVIQEEAETFNGFKNVYTVQWRVLEIINGVYTVSLFQKQQNNNTNQEAQFIMLDGYPVTPKQNGKTMEAIPFYFINSTGTSSSITRSPIAGLVNVNLSHYRNSVDLEHGRHFTGLPTPWAAGFDNDGQALHIGSQKAWTTDESQARCGYLEFTGQGLNALEKALESKEGLMAVLGARLLEPQKNSVEAADTQIVRKSSENSILANTADIVSEVFTNACLSAAMWLGKPNAKLKVTLQRDFMDVEVDARILAELTQMLQSGAISYDTFFYNLKKMEVVPDGRSQDDELDLIEVGRFGGLAPPKATQPGSPSNPLPTDPKAAQVTNGGVPIKGLLSTPGAPPVPGNITLPKPNSQPKNIDESE